MASNNVNVIKKEPVLFVGGEIINIGETFYHEGEYIDSSEAVNLFNDSKLEMMDVLTNEDDSKKVIDNKEEEISELDKIKSDILYLSIMTGVDL